MTPTPVPDNASSRWTPARRVAHAAGLLMMLLSVVVVGLLATGHLGGVLDAWTCADGVTHQDRACGFGEVTWSILVLDGCVFLAGAIIAGLSKPDPVPGPDGRTPVSAAFTIDLSKLRR